MTERNTTAGVLIKDNLYLVARRKEGGPLSLKWEFIGGKNRYGETLEETLKREWKEEVGLDIEVNEFLLKTEFTNSGTHYTLHAYRVSLPNPTSPVSLSVHEAIRWVDKATLSSLDFGPSDSVIRDYLINNCN